MSIKVIHCQKPVIFETGEDYSSNLLTGCKAIVIKEKHACPAAIAGTFIQAFIWNTRDPVEMLREKAQVGYTYKVEIPRLNRKSDSIIVAVRFL